MFAGNATATGNDQQQPKEAKDLETMGTNLVFKLQMMIEETNNCLQEIAQRMELSVPKVVGEAEVLGKEVKDLANYVIDVRSKLLCTEQQSSEAVESLIKLDTAKMRLQETYKSLQEANNWTTLTIDVEDVFENGDIEQISIKLLSMQKSLEMLSLSSSGGGENIREKLELVDSLKNRFEKLIEPKLHEALANQNSEQIATYSKLFRDLHRSDRLIVFYQTCLRDQLLREWSTQVALDSKETLLDWLNFLYDRLITIWKTQMNFCMKVLYSNDNEGSLTILCNIYTDIILSLDPTIEACFERYIQQKTTTMASSSDKTWRQKSLIELKQLTNHFVRSVEQNIISSNNNLVGVGLTLPFIERVSSLDSFVRTLYRPFVGMHQRFLQFERERFSTELATIISSCTSIVVCSEFIIKLFVLARESLKLYQAYVESYPLPIVDDVLQEFLLRFLAHIRTNLNQTLSAASIHQANATGRSNLVTSTSPTPNWSLVQQTLFAFQIVGEFLLQLENFQQQVLLCLVETKDKIELAPKESGAGTFYLGRFDLFILNLDSNSELRERIKRHIDSARYQTNSGKNTSQVASNNVLEPVHHEAIKLAKISAQAICDSIMEYVQIYLVNLFASIKQQIQSVEDEDSDQDKEHEQHDIESHSFSPHEYITQIGQYLLTLPQHLEPFNPNENGAFKLAMRNSIDIFAGECGLPSATIDTTTELLLDSILRQTTRSFLDHILRLPSTRTPTSKKPRRLSTNIRKQIGVDLAYLAAVCEDLGLTNDKDYLLWVQAFNECPNLEAFRLLQEENPTYDRTLKALEDLIQF